MSRTYRSFAKVNLHLEVPGRRTDGYHELRTVFQTVSLYDEIEVAPGGKGVKLAVAGVETPSGFDNLVHRAATLFLARWDAPGVAFRLTKRIPVGAGLGGGSSNAATVLMALRDLAGRPPQVEELVPLAAELGADVPYFLVGGTAVGLDRGDRIVEVPDLPEQPILIVSPPVGVPTATVFASHRVEGAQPSSGVLEDVTEGRVQMPSDVVGRNDLQTTVLGLFPVVEELYTALVQSEAEQVQVSGSGGSMFAFYASPPNLRALANGLPDGCQLFSARTLSRSGVAESRIVGSRGDG